MKTRSLLVVWVVVMLVFPVVLLTIGIYEGLMQVLYRAGILHATSFLGIEYYQGLTLHGVVGRRVPATWERTTAYVRIGSNVGLSACFLIGHDGAVAMLNRAYGVKLDAVGKIDIRDNVFVGFNAIILPGVTIGPNAIVPMLCPANSSEAPLTVNPEDPSTKISSPACSLATVISKLPPAKLAGLSGSVIVPGSM